MAVGTPTDRPKSVCNRSAINDFVCISALSLCFCEGSVGKGPFLTLQKSVAILSIEDL